MKVINPMFVTEIVNNKNVNNTNNLDNIQMSSSNGFNGVNDSSIPVDISVFREVHTVKVEPNIKVEPHSHKYPVFRYITEGSMILNNTMYDKNDWMVVPSEQKYEIKSGIDGYKAICWCIIWGNEVGPIL